MSMRNILQAAENVEPITQFLFYKKDVKLVIFNLTSLFFFVKILQRRKNKRKNYK